MFGVFGLGFVGETTTIRMTVTTVAMVTHARMCHLIRTRVMEAFRRKSAVVCYYLMRSKLSRRPNVRMPCGLP